MRSSYTVLICLSKAQAGTKETPIHSSCITSRQLQLLIPEVDSPSLCTQCASPLDKPKRLTTPFAIVDDVNKILDKMEDQGKAVQVRHATWASPCFPVPKRSGDCRLVVDFKKTMNPQLRVIETTHLVLSRLDKHNVRSNLSKCEWLVDKIDFLGFMISKFGRQPSPHLTSAISNAASPTNVLQWTSEHQKVFEQCKDLITSDKVLMHFDTNLPIVVYTDASPYGIGSALCHTVTVNNRPVDRPVCFVSCTLSPAQCSAELCPNGWGRFGYHPCCVLVPQIFMG
ncbi:Transposon Tf2-9 polyprotein [Frankliniella fusca]|uniref:Transposon Tf2-9 polyprotein n=1 Tax=Frankliniella fusca TaxID=407009 RepID=A0AAE1HE51_9NEOP|nr:Transposon Tf2-9 polyprotein [Frankliniella fusca]